MKRPVSSNAFRWPFWLLAAAAVYNIGWGASIVLFPQVPFAWAGMDLPNYISLWQCIGMIVGVYGIGYAIAAYDPVQYWPLVLVGLLGKIFGPIGFVLAVAKGELPWVAGLTILSNDVVWWIPFVLVLRHAWKGQSSLDDHRLTCATACRG